MPLSVTAEHSHDRTRSLSPLPETAPSCLHGWAVSFHSFGRHTPSVARVPQPHACKRVPVRERVVCRGDVLSIEWAMSWPRPDTIAETAGAIAQFTMRIIEPISSRLLKTVAAEDVAQARTVGAFAFPASAKQARTACNSDSRICTCHTISGALSTSTDVVVGNDTLRL